jgi:hypothetical protein
MNRDYATKVTITVDERNNLDDYPDCQFSITFDAADFNVTQWFRAFEKVLKQVGFIDRCIMEGAAALAFHEFRDNKDMQAIYNKFELDEFAPPQENPVDETPF